MRVVKTTFDLSETTVTLLREAQGARSRVVALEQLLWSHPKLVRIAKRLKLQQPIRPKQQPRIRQTGPRLRQRKLF